MRVDWAGCTRNMATDKRIRAGVAAMDARDAHVTVTADFDATVRSLTGETGYSSDRGTGEVAGKTIGERILLNAAVLPRIADADVERLAAHEAGHVILNRRGETHEALSELDVPHDLGPHLGAAATALEEFRIERELADLGYPSGPPVAADHLADVLHATLVDVVTACVGPRSDDVHRMMSLARGAADRLVKLLAYIAAANIAGQPLDLTTLSADAAIDWRDFVEPSWVRRLTVYSSVPAVATAISAETWTDAVLEAAEVERDLLNDLGYEFRVSPAGLGFYRVRPDAHWDARVVRLMNRFDQWLGDDASSAAQ